MIKHCPQWSIAPKMDGAQSLGMPIEISSKYWAARSHLIVVDGTLLLFDDRIVMPCNIRKEMLTGIHSDDHLNLKKSLKRAQLSIWWPELSADVKGWVVLWDVAFVREIVVSRRAEPLKPTLLPERLWEKLGMNLCHYKCNNFLIVLDHYSRWTEIIHLQEPDSFNIITKLKNLVSKFSFPERVISNGRPQFQSAFFQKSCYWL